MSDTNYAERRESITGYEGAAGIPQRFFKTNSAAFSPIMIDGALVFPEVTLGMIDASAILSPSIPWTFNS